MLGTFMYILTIPTAPLFFSEKVKVKVAKSIGNAVHRSV